MRLLEGITYNIYITVFSLKGEKEDLTITSKGK